MNAKKALKNAERALKEGIARRSAGDSGGIKLMPSLAHGAMPAPRTKNVPVINSRKVNLEEYEEWE